VQTVRIETPFGSFESLEGDHITGHLIEFGAYQRSDLAMLRSFVRPGDCVLDVGAHIGTFSVPLGRAVGASGRVVAFEPVAEQYELLARNITCNDLNGIVEPVRAIVASGVSPLYIVATEGNTGGTAFSREGGEPVADVPVVALDTWWRSWSARPPSVDVIKIDVEGMEYEVIASGTELIDQFRPVVHFEVDFNRRPRLALIDSFFRSRGYQFFVNPTFRDTSTDAFKLARLLRLEHLRRAAPRIFDVVAVDPASSRFPHQAGNAFLTEMHLMRLAARTRTGRLLRRVGVLPETSEG
jgi:FkbM family methyltransferase